MLIMIARTAAWIGVLLLLVVTVSPIGLRPTTGFSADTERFAALIVLGLAFGFGYGNHAFRMIALVVGIALLFELGQHLFPNRHGTIHDAALKSVAGATGVVVGHLVWRAYDYFS